MAFLALFAAVGGAAQAANWQPVASDKGERVEIDKARIARVGKGKVMAWSRLVLGRDEAIAGSKDSYSMVEALNRYDCEGHRFATVKRVYLREGKLVRQEPVDSPNEMAAAAGSIDEKLLTEACKPRTVGEMGKVAEAAGKVASEAKSPEPPAKAMQADMRSAAVDKDKASQRQAANARTAATENAPAQPSYVRRRSRLSPVAAPEAPREEIHWSYQGDGGPANWGKLRPDFSTCASGKRQSPIDIRSGIQVDLEPIKFDYKTVLFRIVDTGHTIRIDIGQGSTIAVMGRQYELTQIHFHRPSEERVNSRGYDMVAHLVHQDEDGHLAVVAVLLEKGTENPLIQTLWNNLPLEVGQDLAPNVAIDLAGFLPESRAYFAYMGSLTTPPCTEDVLWLVMKQPLPVSPEQVAIFSRLYRNNARPIQPTNGRLIKESR